MKGEKAGFKEQLFFNLYFEFIGELCAVGKFCKEFVVIYFHRNYD